VPPVFTDDRTTLTFRLGVLQYVIAVFFAMLAVCFWYTQVLQHAKFLEMAENNHQRTLPLRAPRGMLFDRNGKVMVENRDALNISLVRENKKTLDRSIGLLAEITNVKESDIREILERNRKVPSYRPVVIIQDASLAQISAVYARRHELPDVLVEQVPTRRYPSDDVAAHLFGYVGEITDSQLTRPEFASLTPGAIVGQAGLEQTYNSWLMGRDGVRLVVVNSIGRELDSREASRPAEGKRLELTIDTDIQRAAQDGFSALGYNGAAIMLAANSGEVLALVSRPAFDPNAFAGGIDHTTWASLTTDELRPLQNRAIQGRYSPGSTFKMAVALAALEEGVVTPDFRVHCGGSAVFYGHPFRCWRWNRGGHGSVDMRAAIEQSCDVYFYTVGNLLGVDRINKWATLLGLGVKSGIDLPSEVQGLVPSTQWKREKMKEKWYAGETISVAIGQGQVSVTPISMAVYMSTLANGGTRVTPHLVKAIDDGEGWKPVPPPPAQSSVDMDENKLQVIRDGMFRVVNAPQGTAHAAALKGYDMAGKTGTAQVISNTGKQRAGKTTKDLRDHGWFVFLAPASNPEIAGVVFCEHGEHGTNASLIARHMVETYFAKKEGRPVPPPLAPGGKPGVVQAQAQPGDTDVPAVDAPVTDDATAPAAPAQGAAPAPGAPARPSAPTQTAPAPPSAPSPAAPPARRAAAGER
jgi:penicillin-binding protein 2